VSDCSPYRTHPIRVQVDNPSPTAIHQLAVSSPLLGQSHERATCGWHGSCPPYVLL